MAERDENNLVPKHLRPPSGCPDHGIKSIEECAGPTSSSVCLEFCPKGMNESAKDQTLVVGGLSAIIREFRETGNIYDPFTAETLITNSEGKVVGRTTDR